MTIDAADGALVVRGSAPEAVGRVAAQGGIALSELVAVSRSLEDAFFELTGRRGMRPLLRAELIKLRTTRTFVALAGVAIATSVVIVVLVCLLSEPSEESVLTDVYTADTSSLFITILAIVGITGEWRHRTITSSLLAAPNRLRFLAAKMLAFATAGAMLSLLISVGVGITAYVILGARDLPTPGVGEWIARSAATWPWPRCSGGFGLALGSLLRNQPVAIVTILCSAS